LRADQQGQAANGQSGRSKVGSRADQLGQGGNIGGSTCLTPPTPESPTHGSILSRDNSRR
jgi:hypothetical protein